MSIRGPRSIASKWLIIAAAAAGPAAPPSSVAAPPDDADPSPAPGRMFVVGRVLDPKGKPVPRAAVMVHARILRPGPPPYHLYQRQIPIGDARADGSGRFRIDAPRTSSSHHNRFGVVALAPGHGVGWVELDPDDEQPTADIKLRPEQVVHGRLFDLQGRPVPGVTLSVWGIAHDLPPDRAGGRRRTDNVFFRSRDANDFPAWPRPTITDAEGRFTLRGVGRDLHATLVVHHPRFAHQMILVDTDNTPGAKTLTAALAPSQIVNVRVTYADTGEPAGHAPLSLLASQRGFYQHDEAETDANGRARVNSWPADPVYNIAAYPPERQPYLIASGRIDWPKGALEQSLDLVLPRGVLIRGRVTEEGSGKPVAGALVDFVTHAARQNRQTRSILVETASDGSFRLGVDASPGHVIVDVPGDDYAFQSVGDRMIKQGQPGGGRIYAHAFKALDLKPGIDSQEVNLVVRRGPTVKGRVVGPDDQPVREAWMFSPVILDPTRWVSKSWSGRIHGKVRDGRFEIHGLAPDSEVPVYFLDPWRKLGGVVKLSVKSAAGGPVTVRLEPRGAARARVVDPGGKPVAKPLRDLFVNMVLIPGPVAFTAGNDKAGPLAAEEDDLPRVDPINYPSDLIPDPNGRITLPVLIPGAPYRFIDYTAAVRGQTGPEVRKEFTVKPGETVDLGDIRIEKPPK
jgi:protocatechuate 3,4-dioxygenase beta subunit